MRPEGPLLFPAWMGRDTGKKGPKNPESSPLKPRCITYVLPSANDDADSTYI